ncbi:MAG: ATP synthase F1 subunit delta [Bacteroidetes bacterium]|nr:ATP synthase F1 subunit delta [Bacteroidota bacterium]
MFNNKVAARYSKALFDLALEQNILVQVNDDMQYIKEACKVSRDLRTMLQSPVVKPNTKKSVMHALLADKVNKLTMEFINLLTVKGRAGDVEGIATAFTNSYLKHIGVERAQITTAIALDESMRTSVKTVIKQAIGKEVSLEEKVDKDILGGFIIRVGDRQDDTSLRTKLDKLRRKFQENPYIKEY